MRERGGQRPGNFSSEPASNEQAPLNGVTLDYNRSITDMRISTLLLSSAAIILAGMVPTLAHEPDPSVAKSPPAAPYQQVSKLVKLPDFIPGLGQLFVDPSTLPAGPFLAYDRDGKLVSTIYMIPTKDLNPEKKFSELGVSGAPVDHVDVHYNAGHPGVETPHAHIVLWHVSAAEKNRVAK